MRWSCLEMMRKMKMKRKKKQAKNKDIQKMNGILLKMRLQKEEGGTNKEKKNFKEQQKN